MTESSNERLKARTLINPWVAAFLNWLYAQALLAGVTKVWFVSREGDFLSKAWNRLSFGLPGHYLPVSRALLFKMLVPDTFERDRALGGDFVGTFQAFLSGRLAIDADFAQGLYDARTLTRAISLPTDKRWVAIRLGSQLERLGEVAVREKTLLRTWVAENFGPLEDQRVAIVDVGYSGSIQRMLEKAFGIQSIGFYIMTAFDDQTPNRLQKSGWLLDNGVWGENSLLDSSIILESILQSRTGRCISYNSSPLTGQVAPMFGPKYQYDKPAKELFHLQDIALDLLKTEGRQLLRAPNLDDIGKAVLSFVLDNPSLSPAVDFSISSHDEFTFGTGN